LAIKNEHTHSKHERLCLSVPEVAKTLGISRGLAYELVHSGRLPALHFGRRLLIPRAALERMLNGTQETGVSYK
jgi:excisionase family DNA binding protein